MKALNLAARIVTALALLVNAYIHIRLATAFDALTGTLLSLGDLFRIQAVTGLLVALLVVGFSRRWTALMAGGLAGVGIVMLVISVYAPLDLSAFGLPVISESAWYPDKLVALASQGVAVIAALLAALSTATHPAASGQT